MQQKKQSKAKRLSVNEFFDFFSKLEHPEYTIKYTNTFKKNVNLCFKRNLELEELKTVIEILAVEGTLPEKYLPHPLKNTKEKIMECHIKPNWLLLWQQNENEMILLLVNTGTHSDLL
jgi:mRNA interferase YafQ